MELCSREKTQINKKKVSQESFCWYFLIILGLLRDFSRFSRLFVGHLFAGVEIMYAQKREFEARNGYLNTQIFILTN